MAENTEESSNNNQFLDQTTAREMMDVIDMSPGTRQQKI